MALHAASQYGNRELRRQDRIRRDGSRSGCSREFGPPAPLGYVPRGERLEKNFNECAWRRASDTQSAGPKDSDADIVILQNNDVSFPTWRHRLAQVAATAALLAVYSTTAG